VKPEPTERDSDEMKVRSRYPNAGAERETTGEWCVWDINRDELARLNTEYSRHAFGRMLLGIGYTKKEAWAKAVRTLEALGAIRL
jgi:hypothetical protein